MMLYDTMRAAGTVGVIPVFDITNVEEYVQNAKGWGDAEDVKSMSDAFPPFDEFWMEWQWQWQKSGLPMASHWTATATADGWSCRVRFFVTGENDSRGTRRVDGFDLSFEVRLTKDGRIDDITQVWEDGAVKDGFDNYLFWAGMPTCLQAMIFLGMHEKTVCVMENIPPRHERRQAKRAGQLPPTTYKTIHIRGIGSENDPGTQGGTHQEYRFHICRGHRRKYTEDGKLFGKYVGSFWIAAHTRGNKELGEVVKDYAVEPSESVEKAAEVFAKGASVGRLN